MSYFKSLLNYKDEIIFLSRQTVKKQYAGTIFGSIWAITQPFMYMLVFYFFYQVTGRFGDDINGKPLLLYVFAANIIWLYASQSLVQGSKVFITNAVLVKTIKFPTMALPLIDVLAKFYVHLAVIVVTLIFFVFLGEYPSIYYINFIFYFIMSIIFLTSISLLLGTLSVIIRDIPSFIQSITMPLFWITPIIWVPNPETQQTLILVEKILNPFYFFVDGYRKTMLSDEFFWVDWQFNLYFIVCNIVLMAFSVMLFQKIRPVMADYL